VRADFILLSTFCLSVARDTDRLCRLIGVKVLKCPEGLHSRAFLLTTNSGMDVFAKLANPNAGPGHYTTASEVATRKYVRRDGPIFLDAKADGLAPSCLRV
jgi:hypothetical protein